jgi:hypothetical protein
LQSACDLSTTGTPPTRSLAAGGSGRFWCGFQRPTLPNLEMLLNVEARQALDDFATADMLILSRSSLGYVAALLNPYGVVVYAPWWHPALPDWLSADEGGNLDAAQVGTRIAEYLQRR